MTTRRARPKTIVRTSRVIHAPRERVFRAWTDEREIKQWWGRPESVDISQVEVDLRVDGRYRIVARTRNEGDEYAVSGTYVEVVPLERLVYTFQWEQPLPLPGGHYVGDSRVTVEFRDLGDSTEIVLTHEGFPGDDVAGFHDTGWNRSFDRLAVLVEKGVTL